MSVISRSSTSGSKESSAATGRVLALDILRGIAILGTLASNVWIFTAGFGSLHASEPGWLWRFSMWLPNGKFLGLLTIMFGVGLEIQRQSALRAGRKWPDKYPVRALLLFADGVLNYIFVVQFDVLRAYAVVGVLVAFLLLTSERVQWWLIGLFLGIHFAVLAWQGYSFGARSAEIERDGILDLGGAVADCACASSVSASVSRCHSTSCSR